MDDTWRDTKKTDWFDYAVTQVWEPSQVACSGIIGVSVNKSTNNTYRSAHGNEDGMYSNMARGVIRSVYQGYDDTIGNTLHSVLNQLNYRFLREFNDPNNPYSWIHTINSPRYVTILSSVSTPNTIYCNWSEIPASGQGYSGSFTGGPTSRFEPQYAMAYGKLDTGDTMFDAAAFRLLGNWSSSTTLLARAQATYNDYGDIENAGNSGVFLLACAQRGLCTYSTGGFPTISVATPDVSAAEIGGDAGQFTISRTGATTSNLTVYYTLTGTATNGTDYQTIPASTIIPAGSASVNVNVIPIDDVLSENNETVILKIVSGSYLLGTTIVGTVTIQDNEPFLSTFSPNFIGHGVNSPLLTFTGANFSSGAQIEFTRGTNVLSKAATFVNNTTLTTTLTANDTTTLGLGTGTVRVLQGGVYTATAGFTIINPTIPHVTGISPTSIGYNVASPNIVLSGYFSPGDQMEFIGQLGTVTKTTPTFNAGNTTLTTTLTAGETQTLGLGAVTVSAYRPSTSGYSVPNTIVISNSTGPVITDISPNIGAFNEWTTWNSINGTGLATGTAIIDVGSFTVPSAQTRVQNGVRQFQLKDVDTLALGVGAHPVTVTISGNTSNAVDFFVAGPILNSVLPNSIPTNAAATLQFTGQYLGSPSTIHIGTQTYAYTSGPFTLDLTSTQVNTLGAGVHNLYFETASTGVYSNALPFTITTTGGNAPALSGISPTDVAHATAQAIVLAGTNYASGAVVNLNGVPLPSAQVVVNSPTQITANLTTSNTTISGSSNAQVNVTVTQSSFTTAPKILTLHIPDFTNNSPASLEYNTNPTPNLDLTGNYFGNAPSVSVGSLTFNAPTIVSSSLLRIPGNSAGWTTTQLNSLGVGLENITINNTGKSSAARTITITDPTPLLRVQSHPPLRGMQHLPSLL
jgi:hypothetical protein